MNQENLNPEIDDKDEKEDKRFESGQIESGPNELPRNGTPEPDESPLAAETDSETDTSQATNPAETEASVPEVPAYRSRYLQTDPSQKESYLDPDERQEFKQPEVPDPNDFDEDEIFCRMTTDENIFNSRGLAHAPKMSDTSRDRYLQMGCCAQMHCYEWTDQFPEMSAESDFPIVQVRFKNTHKDFFRIPENEEVKSYQTGDIVTVESTNGHDTGVICLKGELVRLQLKKKGLPIDSPNIRKIYRKARQTDIDKWTETIQAEKEMQRRARILAAQLGLSMKINNVEIQGDFTKAIFYYTAEDRVDFRQLIKLYAEEFKLRIEMRQIGARQESGILGGLGACGRELCCVTFLHNFTSVGTHTARVQQVSLNPQKLAGQCSKLKCCLNFEYEVYMDAMKSMPDQKTTLKTVKGEAHCIKTDPLKRTLTYAYSEGPGGYIELSAEQVSDIIERNQKGETVGELSEFNKANLPPAEPVAEFRQVVGQDDLTRFDKPKEARNRNKDRRKNGKSENSGRESREDRKPHVKAGRPEDRKSDDRKSDQAKTSIPTAAANRDQAGRNPAAGSEKGSKMPEAKNRTENDRSENRPNKDNAKKNKRSPRPVQKPILKNTAHENDRIPDAEK